jgi:hypothetical protein
MKTLPSFLQGFLHKLEIGLEPKCLNFLAHSERKYLDWKHSARKWRKSFIGFSCNELVNIINV